MATASEADKENNNLISEKSANDQKPRNLFTSNNGTNGDFVASPKRRKNSKLKQRRLKSKLQSKRIKTEQIRNQKLKRKNRISTNEMYPKFKPLLENEIKLITDKIINIDINKLKTSDNLGKEYDDGYIEFKWKLISPEQERLEHLMTQMRYRLTEGNGKCIYQIGIEDNGNPKGINDMELIETIKTIFRLNKQLNGDIKISSIKMGQNGKVATLVVKNKNVLMNSDQLERQKLIRDQSMNHNVNTNRVKQDK